MGPNMKLRTQLFIIFSLIIVTVVVTIGYFSYREMETILFEQLRATLTGYATSASMVIDGDRHALLTAPAHMDSPYFIELRDRLKAIAKIDPRISAIYTMVRTDKPDTMKFVVDASGPIDADGNGKISESELPAKLGEEYDASAIPEMKKAFDGPIADRALNRDRWGWWLSGYAPIHDLEGRTVGIVGLDVSAATIKKEEVRMRNLVLLICAVLLALGVVAANFYAYRLTMPINSIVHAAGEIGKGNYDYRISKIKRDEIGFLARTMNSMAENIRRSFDKLSTLNRTANILASTLDLEQALRISLNLVIEVSRSHKGIIFLLDDSEKYIDVAIGEGIGDVQFVGDEWRLGSAAIPRVLDGDRNAQIGTWLELTGCTQCLPLSVKESHRGYFLLDTEIGDEEFLNTLMTQVSFAIENARLFHEAITDGLTGLFLKRYFQIQLDTELKRSRRHRRDIALLMLDIDHFKKINDTYGHPRGDMVLKGVAGVIKANVREIDIVSRYGGEEIAIILPDTAGDQAQAIAERIRDKVAAQRFKCDGMALSVTVSIGVFSVAGGGAVSPGDAIKKADAALYRAKEGGRDRVAVSGST
jgi:diguanylate cyclase (GGDEF)-like protein